MEIYRTLNGPFPGCPSHTVLQKIYQIALPKLRDGDVDVDDIAHASLKVLNERDPKMFFPEGAVKHILDEGTIREVLDCKGNDCCRHARENSLSDFPVLVTWVFNRARILLAVLIYLGHKTWINTFRERRIGDANLDRVISFINTEQPLGLSPGFVKSYEEALDLFRPPTFVMGEPKFTYDDNQRFPYIEDEECGEGSFGKVRRFEIHRDYLHESLAQIAAKYSPPSALAEKSSRPPAVFARKILKYTSDKTEFDMEMQVLRIIDAQKHENIIDLVAFYSWRGELNFVFPFVKLTLFDVLHENWKPETMAEPARFPKHWLWQQMILVADALQTIHNPPKQKWSVTVVGFHFDLKPKNILVTPDGILKITDFGQSMVKMVEDKESAYGTYIGGDFTYGPPEVAPTRSEVKELVFSPSLQSSGQLPEPPTSPSTASRKSSAAVSHRSSYDSRKQSSTKSIQSPVEGHREFQLERKESFAKSVFEPSLRSNEIPPVTVKANYDVWSLACIMTEVLTFIFEEGANGVSKFENSRRDEGGDLGFHKGTKDRDCLRNCVRNKLDSFQALDDPDAISTLIQSNSYLSDVVGLLEDMFTADPTQRLSSEMVVIKLNTIATNHKEDSDPDADILRFMRNLGGFEGFKEQGYRVNDGIVPFYTMADIKLKIDEHTNVDCRLQLFRKDGAINVRIRYGERFINDMSHTFDTKDSSFCPMYLFDPLRRPVCCLKDKHHQRTFYFGSDEDLMTFQTAVMRQHAWRGIRVSEVDLRPKGKQNETYPNLYDQNTWGRCQIWQTQHPEYVPARSSIGPMSPRCTIGSIKALFFSSNAFFGIPLQDGKKMMAREKQGSLKEAAKQVVIERQGGWDRYFHYLASDVSRPLSNQGELCCPAIPLSSSWLKVDDSRRATKLEMTFPSNLELLQFKQEVLRANKEMPWKDALGKQGQKPPLFKSNTFR